MTLGIDHLHVRPARISDAPAIARVYVETWRTTYAGVIPDRVLVDMSEVRQASRWHADIERDDRGHAIMVAELDRDRVVGMGSAGPARGGDKQAGEIYTLYVEHDWHGLGVGRRLLAALFEVLIDQGRTSAILWVLAANPSRFFYETVGGRRTVERIEKLWGTDLPEIGYVWDDIAAAIAPGGPCSSVDD